jgi:hypothetical protein
MKIVQACLIALCLLAAVPAQAEDKTYHIPFFQSGGSEWTGLSLYNIGSNKAEKIVVTVYDTAGNEVEKTSNIKIKSKGTYTQVLGQGTETEGWIKIKSDQKLAGVCFIGDSSYPDYIYDIDLAEGTQSKVVFPHVAVDAIWDTTIQVCNPGSSKIKIHVKFRDSEAKEQYKQDVEIKAKSSVTVSVRDLVEDTTWDDGSIYINSDSGSFVAFGVYSSLETGGTSIAGISPTKITE